MAGQESEVRVPPHNIDAEMSVLGALLLGGDTVGEICQALKPEDYYRSAHREIYSAVLELYNKRAEIDGISVAEELRRRGTLAESGGDTYLVTLAETVPSAASAAWHASIVREKAILRRMVEVATDIARKAFDAREPARQLLDEAEQGIFEIARLNVSAEPQKIDVLLTETFNRLEKMRDRAGRLSGIPTGYYDLDDLTCGLQRGDLIIVAGRPSMGKTTFALNLLERAARKDGEGNSHGVAFFSLEMSHQQVLQNILCARAGVDSQSLRKGRFTTDDYKRLWDVANDLYDQRVFIDDTPGITPIELRAKCRRLKQRHGIDMVIVDYLQLMSAGIAFDNRQQEIALISRSLKGLAREINVPVIALSQLNRSVENREEHRPRMSDLRESGAIEQDADLIMMLHREEVFKPSDKNKGLAEVIICKQRNGPTGAVTLRFFGNQMRFENFQPQAESIQG
jgi:replicative DNA helicase